jgi:hypothetical protein
MMTFYFVYWLFKLYARFENNRENLEDDESSEWLTAVWTTDMTETVQELFPTDCRTTLGMMK